MHEQSAASTAPDMVNTNEASVMVSNFLENVYDVNLEFFEA